MDNEKKIITFCLLLAGVCSLVFCEEWKASVENSLEALVSSCVVVPCSFSHPRGALPTSRLRGIWHLKDQVTKNIYHDDETKILDSFKKRTKLLGSLGQDNCTLELMPVNDHDNGPFCYRIELVKTEDNAPTIDKFSFVEECVGLKMLNDPPKPVLSHPGTATPGEPYTAVCSVRHTCPSYMPTLTWSQGTKEETFEIYQDINHGIWEVESILTFIPEEIHDTSDLTCTATFHGGRTSSAGVALNVKRAPSVNHVIIHAAVAASLAVIFGVFCVFMVKKYKNRIAELQHQDGSMWSRLSRVSRR
ncbi:myelin-associated glycoprotein-like [Nematolebias whitei]|uniref:myelin-associated glycoprotein-like n=1 Tax=Nematolebias whitei TaxID=451745 RepID=UPI001896EC3B|nr:myelin-associated glycoprotein-like [Nematolebias whitei]